MSRVKAYGFCDAGCRRRVPTFEDFESCVSVIDLPINDAGKCEIEVGKTYRIKGAPDSTNWDFSIAFTLNRDLPNGYDDSQYRTEFHLTLPTFQKHYDSNGMRFTLCGVEGIAHDGNDGKYYDEYIFYLEINDSRSTQTFKDSMGEYTNGVGTIEKGIVAGATKIVQLNYDANTPYNLGDIEEALDEILAIQETLIGGDE